MCSMAATRRNSKNSSSCRVSKDCSSASSAAMIINSTAGKTQNSGGFSNVITNVSSQPPVEGISSSTAKVIPELFASSTKTPNPLNLHDRHNQHDLFIL